MSRRFSKRFERSTSVLTDLGLCIYSKYMKPTKPTQQIRQIRLRRGLTQIELARRAGLSWIYIAKLEGGDRVAPSLPALERIARALGTRLRVELKG